MGTLGIVLLVAFVIVCVLLVLLVIVQDDGENGMGGLLGGRGTAAFGSHSASVLTKTTTVLVVLFFALAVGLAFINKSSSADVSLEALTNGVETTETETSSNESWWAGTETETVEEAETVDAE